MICGCENRAGTQKTKRINEITEMKILRKIMQKSLNDTFISSEAVKCNL
jgi:hypothetical protein